MSAGNIHVGVGGWTYEPWRNGTFYPQKETVVAQKNGPELQLSVDQTDLEVPLKWCVI